MILGTCKKNSWILVVGMWYNEPTLIEKARGERGSKKRFRR